MNEMKKEMKEMKEMKSFFFFKSQRLFFVCFVRFTLHNDTV